uniref:Uncharacterized protein n=1 Tax=Chenopodium quinoa TaxID=63459 RepID=A0A803KTI2_CHEQI
MFITMAVFLVLSMLCSVGEARPIMDDYGSNNGVSVYHSTVYESAKSKLAFWLQKLASGPSDGGAGH